MQIKLSFFSPIRDEVNKQILNNENEYNLKQNINTKYVQQYKNANEEIYTKYKT